MIHTPIGMDEVQEIKQRLNIVDIIQEYLPLKKSGINYKANCPFHHEKTPSFMVSPERGTWHCFGCFPPGELVKTPFGYHKIEEIDQNHWVISGKGNIRQVTDTMVHNYQGDLIQITLRKLRVAVKLTSDHQVFVIRGAPYTRKKYKDFARRYRKYLQNYDSDPAKYFQQVARYFPISKVPAGELTQGDLLLSPIDRTVTDLERLNLKDYLTKTTRMGSVPKDIPLEVPVDEDLLRLIGYWIAEGSNHRAYIRFSLGNHEEKFAQDIIDLIAKVFNLEAKIHRRVIGKKTGLEITACQSQLANIFENLCGKGAANKHLPFVFQQLPISKQLILLQAMHRGDGTTFVPYKSLKAHKSITTISRVLSGQLVDLVLRQGYAPSMHTISPKIDKRGVNHRQSYTVFWSTEANLRYQESYYQPDGTEWWILPIAKLQRETYNGPVYNFTVDKDHSYVATNFAVGNCARGGDVFSFITEKEGLTFPETLEMLAKKAGVVLKNRSSKDKKVNDVLLEIHIRAAEFFHYLLITHPTGKNALEYLHQRGLTDDTIKHFQLGYAPHSWDNLTKFLHKKGFSNQDIINSGLAVASGATGCYDRFRGRIVFPLSNIRGQIIGFSGRVLGIGEPKYINSPQTPIFDKSKFLFGIQDTKQSIRDKSAAILVEGEMDMLFSFQVGVTNIVATKGTALTSDQIELLKRYTDTLLLCFDTDLAGDAASRRGIEIADSLGLNLKVIQLIGGKDPAEVCLKDPALWQKAVDDATPIYDYYLDSVKRRFDINTSVGKKEIFHELIPIWQKITDPITKDHYIQKLSALLQTTDALILKELAKPLPTVASITPPTSSFEPEIPTPIPANRRQLLEDYLLALMLHLPDGHDFVPKFPETIFSIEENQQLFVLLVLYLDKIAFSSKNFDINAFSATLNEPLAAHLDRLYLLDLEESLTEAPSWQRELDKTVDALKKMFIKGSLERLSLQIKTAQSFNQLDTLNILNKKFRDLSVKLKNL